MDSVKIDGVLSADVETVWPLIESGVSKAIEKGNSFEIRDASDVKNYLLSRDMQLWFVYLNDNFTGFFITQIVNSRYKTLNTFALSGVEMLKWIGAYENLVHEFAKHHECKYLRCFGRPGWAKILKKYGWHSPSVAYVKEVQS